MTNTVDAAAANSPTMSKKSPTREPDNKLDQMVFGYDISGINEQNKFGLLAGLALVSACSFALLQEKVFRVEGFKFGGLMTLITTLTFFLLAAFERWCRRDYRVKATMKSYAILSITTMGGMYFTNWSLNYLNYPVRIMFKASKVVPVMLVSVVMQGSRYTPMEYANAVVLVVGIALFTMGDMAVSPKFDPFGIILISVGVGFDAITSNYEEKHFFKECGCSHYEVMMFSSLFATGYAFLTLVISGEASVSIAHSVEHPEVYGYIISSAAMGYLSVSFVLLLIKLFGATAAEVVKSCRKVISIILSFLLLSKPVTQNHYIGGLIFASAVGGGAYLKIQGKRAAAAAMPK